MIAGDSSNKFSINTCKAQRYFTKKMIYCWFLVIMMVLFLFTWLIPEITTLVRDFQINKAYPDYQSSLYKGDTHYVDLNSTQAFSIDFLFYKHPNAFMSKNLNLYSIDIKSYPDRSKNDFEGFVKIKLTLEKGAFLKNQDCKALTVFMKDVDKTIPFSKDLHGNSYIDLVFKLPKNNVSERLVSFYGCNSRVFNASVSGVIKNYKRGSTFLITHGGR